MSASKPRLTSTTYEFPIRKPVEKKTLRQLIYDGEKGRILGRTPKNWGTFTSKTPPLQTSVLNTNGTEIDNKETCTARQNGEKRFKRGESTSKYKNPKYFVQLIVFYVIFYTVLASLFTICLQGLFLTLNDEYPKWQLDSSIIGTNPGLGFRPMADDVDEGSLIWYKATNASEVEKWTRRLDQFLEPYRNKSKLPEGGKNQIICDFDNAPADHQVCSVDVEDWGPCSPSEGYSYNKSSPCIFLKLNRIYGWKPEFYNDPSDLPEQMPQELKNFIATAKETERNQIWISCEGQDGVDKENLGDRLEYYPKTLHGFPEYYYPYRNIPGYLSPLVAVRLLRPPVNQILNIECKAWAKNIIVQGGRDRLGSVHFEVMIDQ